VAPGRYRREIAHHKLTFSLATSAPSQLGLAAYLEKGGYERHLRRLRKTLERQQQEYMGAIARHFPEGTRMTRPQGGYFLWVELPPQVDALALHRQALAQGISLAPGPMFSASRAFRHCIRLNYGHPLGARAEQAITTLGTLATAFLSPPVGAT